MGELEEVGDNDAGLEGLGSLANGTGPVGELGDETGSRGLAEETKVDLDHVIKVKQERKWRIKGTSRKRGTALFMSFMEQRRACEYWR